MRVGGISPLGPGAAQILTAVCRIVEYATRDQAQNAVTTLSNQNLMGRLVYVREVRFSGKGLSDMGCHANDGVVCVDRTARPSRDSIRHREEAVEATVVAPWALPAATPAPVVAATMPL